MDLALWIATFLGIGMFIGGLVGHWWACFVAIAIGVLITVGDRGGQIPKLAS
jgi:hypothetical protein